ncbi:MAG: ThuA domain-containing protein [Gemmatimonadetes bacterium]|nr:ThuA domain-containing protein [Gemmatimonadota bacterium]
MRAAMRAGLIVICTVGFAWSSVGFVWSPRASVTDPTAIGAPSQEVSKKLLFLTHAGLYKHTSLGPAERAVASWGPEAGYELTVLQGYLQDADELDLSIITAEYLAQFDGVMMMTNGNLPLDDGQKRALVDFVRQGGAFIGIHCAALTLYNYPDFGEMLGAYFRRAVQQNHVFVLRVEDQEHPATRMLGGSWTVIDEMYQFGTAAWSADRPDENVDVLFGNRIPVGFSRDRVRVLLSIDTRATDIDGLEDIEQGGDYPQSWVQEFGEGRSFYTSLGHRDDIWSTDPTFRAHVVGGIRWALGLEDGDATPG